MRFGDETGGVFDAGRVGSQYLRCLRMNIASWNNGDCGRGKVKDIYVLGLGERVDVGISCCKRR